MGHNFGYIWSYESKFHSDQNHYQIYQFWSKIFADVDFWVLLNIDICSVRQIYEILVIQIGILVITVGVLATILWVNSVNLIKYT